MKGRVVFSAVLIAMWAVSAPAVTVDADGYAAGTDISGAFSGVVLSSVGGYSGLDGSVYAWSDGLASTGTSVFANNLSFQRQWYAGSPEGFALRADFSLAADYVSIDIIGNDYSGDKGVLYAYDSGGVLLDTVVTPVLGYGEAFSAVVSRGAFDISYVVAGGAPGSLDTVHLDNLSVNVVPEPGTIAIWTLCGFVLAKRRKRDILRS